MQGTTASSVAGTALRMRFTRSNAAIHIPTDYLGHGSATERIYSDRRGQNTIYCHSGEGVGRFLIHNGAHQKLNTAVITEVDTITGDTLSEYPIAFMSDDHESSYRTKLVCRFNISGAYTTCPYTGMVIATGDKRVEVTPVSYDVPDVGAEARGPIEFYLGATHLITAEKVLTEHTVPGVEGGGPAASYSYASEHPSCYARESEEYRFEGTAHMRSARMGITRVLSNLRSYRFPETTRGTIMSMQMLMQVYMMDAASHSKEGTFRRIPLYFEYRTYRRRIAYIDTLMCHQHCQDNLYEEDLRTVDRIEASTLLPSVAKRLIIHELRSVMREPEGPCTCINEGYINTDLIAPHMGMPVHLQVFADQSARLRAIRHAHADAPTAAAATGAPLPSPIMAPSDEDSW